MADNKDQRPAPDLEREVTCFICTDILYQPLTLLDCLHTFCGSCLKEWFSWQAAAAESAPIPPPAGTPVFTCPACRAAVRDAVHNANAVRLLDIFLAISPDKGRTEVEKDELSKKYKPGDLILPKLHLPEATPARSRLDAEERRLIQEVRELSLREAIAESSSSQSHTRRHHHGHSSTSRSPAARSADRSRDPSRESGRETRAREGRDRSHRHSNEETARRHAEQSGTLQPEDPTTPERRHRRSGSRQRAQEASERRSDHHVEHQSSLRSLISATNLDSRDMEREVEEFARQIQEEGLLDGLDLDNIDLSHNDELSRKIREAYRRRQRERSRQDTARTSDPGGASQSRIHGAEGRRSSSRHRTHSQSPSVNSQSDERRARPPPSATTGSSHLEVHDAPEQRHRRRTTSGTRSSTTPVVVTAQSEPRAALVPRSQTDIAPRPAHVEQTSRRPVTSDARSSSSPIIGTVTQSPTAEATRGAADLSFSARAGAPPPPSSVVPAQPVPRSPPSHQSPEVPRLFANFASPTAVPGHQRKRSKLYDEPSIACDRCDRQHIEYDVHYNCSICHDGNWNICLRCYRDGKGCLHWLGFGYGAWNRWQRTRQKTGGAAAIPEPHMLTANRYLPPRAVPGGADGRRTMTNEDPQERLQSGTFCARCLAWTNDCFWRCDICNEGDWGFCNDCVNQGRCCTHPLLPLARYPPAAGMAAAAVASSSSPFSSPSLSSTTTTPPTSPLRSPTQPVAATFLSSANAMSIGSFRPLVFNVPCEICRAPIPPAQTRYHCPVCPSSLAPVDPPPPAGDYNVCAQCYSGLVHAGDISPENGPGGWRRCPLQGHRMVVVGFQDGKGGLWRYVVRDLVGGMGLRMEPFVSGTAGAAAEGKDLQVWSWFTGDAGDTKHQRLVTRDVRARAPPPPATHHPASSPLGGPTTATTTTETGTGAAEAPSKAVFADAASFPPDGGTGLQLAARWAWWPQEGQDDELPFPRGAEIHEIEDVNGEWFFGAYMGARGLFPAPYVWRGGGGGDS